MATKDEIRDVIYSAIDEVNLMLPKDRKIEKASHAPLSADKGGLDSLGLINMIIAIEQKLEGRFKKSVSLANEQMMPQGQNPFANVDTLADYILKILEN